MTPTERANARVANVLERAIQVFGDEESAKAWLLSDNRALGGVSPTSMLDTDAGHEAVIDVLGRIENGVIA